MKTSKMEVMITRVIGTTTFKLPWMREQLIKIKHLIQTRETMSSIKTKTIGSKKVQTRCKNSFSLKEIVLISRKVHMSKMATINSQVIRKTTEIEDMGVKTMIIGKIRGTNSGNVVMLVTKR